VRHTAKVLAQVQDVSEAEIASVTSANFFTLFAKAKPPANGGVKAASAA
jgi:hypothetical protein